MGKRYRIVQWLLVLALGLQWLPLPASAAAADSAGGSTLFADGFDGGLANWDLFGSTAWQVQGSGTDAVLTGSTTSTAPQRAVVKAAALPYSSSDYAFSFRAEGDRFRAMFRYTSGTSYYFLEFKNASLVELWKYPNSSASVQVGQSVDISAAIPGFSLTAWHDYRVDAVGSTFTLSVDGVATASFADSSLTAGGVGFALKSVGPAVGASVDQVEVRTVSSGSGPLAIQHTPPASLAYNADLPLLFTVSGSPASATVHYGYGDEETDRTMAATGDGSGSYAAAIPGTNRADRIRYYLTAQDSDGGTARYPETGDVSVPIEAMAPYFNDFEAETVGTAPSGWTTGGSAKVIQLPDGGKALNLNGSGSAKLNLPMYRNADNFVVKFKAKYERTSTAVQNTWRLRYRATDDSNNNALEWATHNSKYFLMRKTSLGGNYPIANYVQSLLGDWHDYELRVSGITHRLYIDGALKASGDDSDPLAPQKGYFQWNVVSGINLTVDDFSIDPIPLPEVVDLQPSGNYAGIYAQGESPGLSVALDAGGSAREFKIDYAVSRADGDKATIVTGSKTYDLAKYEQAADTLPFEPGLGDIGTYDVAADVTVDGEPQPGLSKRMRIAVVSQAAPVSTPDLDNESKFGLNTHYALNWRDDIIDGARKLGARSHRSGVSWDSVDKNVKDASGATIYDYGEADAMLGKLFDYGFNQIPVLGIDKNAYYQSGTVNTTAALQAMGDFVYQTVDRYKGRIRQWEMPNEPEINAQPYIPEEYVQLQKTAYLQMKKADPDAMLLAGDHTSSVLSVLPQELALGSYDFADAYSFHPYVYNSMPDDNLANMLNGVKDLVNAYGGWKDYYLTEGGWPTANGGYPSVSEATQRDYIVRAFLTYMTIDQAKVYEYYDYKNDGTDDRYYDIFWGITDNDGRPKLAYAAVNQLMTELDQSRYVGTWNAGDPNVSVQLFVNNGEPVLVAWKKVDAKDDPAVKPPTSEITLPFAAADVTLKDIDGAEMQPAAGDDGKLRLTVSGSPVYVTGIPADFVYSAAAQLLEEKRSDAAAKLTALRTDANDSLVDEDASDLAAIASGLTGALNGTGGGSPAADLEQGIGDVYALMSRMAGQIGDGSLAQAPGNVTLEALYNLAESSSVALSYAMDGSAANSLDYEAATQAATAAFNAKKGEASVMPVSASAVLRMNRYGRLATAAHNRGDYGESYAYNLLAREFAGAVSAIVASEPARFIGVMANLVPVRADAEAGTASPFALSLTNDTDTPRQVTVQLKLPDGWEASQTGPLTADYTIPAFGSTDAAFQIAVPEDTVKGQYTIGFGVLYDGAVFDTKEARLTVQDGIGVRVLPVDRTISDTNAITVELTGTSSLEKSGTVTVKGPDGTKLAPVTTDAFSSLKLGDKAQLSFQWTDHEPVPFHEYPVDVQVEESASGKAIFHDPALPLDFNVAQKVQDVTVDGDLTDWQDAYPIHLRRDDQNATGYHDPANLKATAYVKWADDGLYAAVSVQDNIHKQSENAANLWKNDSVQVSLDPLNNREAPYGPDDVEWGFALTDAGALLTNVFSATPPNPSGDLSGQVPFAAVRDEANHRTLYEFKIPSADVKDLQPALGGSIGFNVAVNDADLQNGRDNFIQWTPGTADAKNTSLYDSFVFVEDNDPPPAADTEPPVLHLDAPQSVSRVGSAKLTLEAEDAGSGVASVDLRLDGQPIASPYTIEPLSLAAGKHEIAAQAEDLAGNRAFQSASIEVIMTVDDLDDLLNDGYDRGWIAKEGTLQSLLAKAETIQKEAARPDGNPNYKPLLNEISAQTGKAIDAGFASALQGDIAYLQGS
ncbi:sugar-binding protein [Cohnella zeiphila]|uniref:Carbohydrate-binding domain-containing protein n=1 Tax=Cohnella zeiphila TaxID=2761120 RepID=A0A7X0SJR7_9BACL|nr:sugar-binding protein [Cohnella zeiphila]MBB6730094.1 hypothetical protein [Cohnella zeiphila]